MPQICPHCHHVRKADEVAPDWQCPACERAYAKGGDSGIGRTANSVRPAPVAAASRGGLGKWLLVLVVLAAALWYVEPAWLGTAAQPDADRYGQPEVVLYATSWCGYCKAAREFFAANGIEYIELDVEKSATAQQGHRELGGGGVPVVVVGNTVIHGFNEPELRRALKPWLRDS